MNNKEILRTAIKVELARRKFYNFCCVMIPKVYNDKRPYLKKLCNDLEDFWFDDTKRYLLLSLPPRHCKTLTIGLFVDYLLMLDKNTKIMTGSYNEDFSALMSKTIRNRIQEVKIDKEKIVYSDICDTAIEKGSGQAHQFKVEGSNTVNVLSTSINGSATGFGANLIILDDMLKSASESYNNKQKDKIYDWFINTMLSRLEGERQKVVIISTRWAKNDLIGRVLDWDDEKTVEINLKAYDEKTNSMLCDDILNKEQFEELKKRLSVEILNANYQGIPMDLKDRLYTNFNIYKKEEIKDLQFDRIFNYTDTADTGQDSLVSVTVGFSYKHRDKLFILDIYQSKNAMEYTEPILASKLKEFEVMNCRIEGNNGGRGYARTVSNIYTDDLKQDLCDIKTFTQTKNKMARIFSNRHLVQSILYYPDDWAEKYPEYFKEMIEMKAEGTNEHDDSADATTGIIETAFLYGLFV